MAITKSQSKFAFGIEATVGTPVAAGVSVTGTNGGIAQEGFIELMAGLEYEVVEKLRGLPFRTENCVIPKGSIPSSPQFNHNLNMGVLHAILGSAHVVTAGTGDAWQIYPKVGALQWTLGDAVGASGERTFTIRHEREATAAAGLNQYLAGCVMRSLTLTFPIEGGPVKMAWDVSAFAYDNDEDDSSAAGFTYPSQTLQDLIVSDFEFYFGTADPPSKVYPASDVVVTLTPNIVIEKRGTDAPYTIVVDGYAASFSMALAYDSAPDTLQTHFDANTLCYLTITNVGAEATAPSAAGELRINMMGKMVTEPGTEGEGILKDVGEFECEGNFASSAPPYEFKVFEEDIFGT
jgi:hypothetical protein